MLAFTFKLGQKQAQLRSPMETVKICSKCVGSTINAGSGFHGSSMLRLFFVVVVFFFVFFLVPVHVFSQVLPVKVIHSTDSTLYIIKMQYFNDNYYLAYAPKYGIFGPIRAALFSLCISMGAPVKRNQMYLHGIFGGVHRYFISDTPVKTPAVVSIIWA